MVYTNVIQGIEGDYATGQMAHPAFFVEISCNNGVGSANVVHAGSSMETVDSFVENFDLGAGSSSVPSKVSLVIKLNKCWLSSSPDAASSTASTTSLIEMGC